MIRETITAIKHTQGNTTTIEGENRVLNLFGVKVNLRPQYSLEESGKVVEAKMLVRQRIPAKNGTLEESKRELSTEIPDGLVGNIISDGMGGEILQLRSPDTD